MAFPATATDGQVHTENSTRYIYQAASNSWLVDPKPDSDKDCHDTQRIINIPEPRLAAAGLKDLIPRDYADRVRPWATAIDYTPGHLLEDNDQLYLVVTAHTSTIAANDIAAGLLVPVGLSGDYKQVTVSEIAAASPSNYALVGDGLILTINDTASLPGSYHDILSRGANNHIATSTGQSIVNSVRLLSDAGRVAGAEGGDTDQGPDGYAIAGQNAAALVVDAERGPAYSCPVSGGANGFVLTGYKGIGGSAIRSVAFSVRLDATAPTNQRVAISWGSGSATTRYRVQVNPARTSIGVDVNGVAQVVAHTFDVGVWYDVALVQSGTTLNTTEVFVDGVSLGLLGNATVNTGNTNDVAIGFDATNAASGSFSLGGLITNIQLFDRAISHAEVISLSAKGVGLLNNEHVRLIKHTTGWNALYYGQVGGDVPIDLDTHSYPWTANTDYAAGDLVLDTINNQLYLVPADYTSSADIATDIAAGDLIAVGAPVVYDDTVDTDGRYAGAAIDAAYQTALDTFKARGVAARNLKTITNANVLIDGGSYHMFAGSTGTPATWSELVLTHYPASDGVNEAYQLAQEIGGVEYKLAKRVRTGGVWTQWFQIFDERNFSLFLRQSILVVGTDLDTVTTSNGFLPGYFSVFRFWTYTNTPPDYVANNQAELLLFENTPALGGESTQIFTDNVTGSSWTRWETGDVWSPWVKVGGDYEPIIHYEPTAADVAWDVATHGRHGVIDSSAGAVTVTLPQAPADGDELHFEVVDSTGGITFDSGAVDYDIRNALPPPPIANLVCEYPFTLDFSDQTGNAPNMSIYGAGAAPRIVFDADLGRNVVEFPQATSVLRADNFLPTNTLAGDANPTPRTIMYRLRMNWVNVPDSLRTTFSWGSTDSVSWFFCDRWRDNNTPGTNSYRQYRFVSTNASNRNLTNNAAGIADDTWYNIVIRTNGFINGSRCYISAIGSDPVQVLHTGQDTSPNGMGTQKSNDNAGLTLNGLAPNVNGTSGIAGLRIADFTVVKRDITDAEMIAWANPQTDFTQLMIDGVADPAREKGHLRLVFFDGLWHYNWSGTDAANHIHSIDDVTELRTELGRIDEDHLSRTGDIMNEGALLRQGYNAVGNATTTAGDVLAGVNTVTTAGSDLYFPNDMIRFANHPDQYSVISHGGTALSFFPPLSSDVPSGTGVDEVTPNANLITDQDAFYTRNEAHQLNFKAWPNVIPVNQTSLTADANPGDPTVALAGTVTVGNIIQLGFDFVAYKVIADNGGNNYDLQPPVVNAIAAGQQVSEYPGDVFNIDALGQNIEVTRGHVEEMLNVAGITVVDNLVSTSTTAALSANQGRILQNTKLAIADYLATPTTTPLGNLNTQITPWIYRGDGTAVTNGPGDAGIAGNYEFGALRVSNFGGFIYQEIYDGAGLNGAMRRRHTDTTWGNWVPLVGGTATAAHFANTDLTFTGDRNHTLDAFNLNCAGTTGQIQFLKEQAAGVFGESRVSNTAAFITAANGANQGTVSALPDAVALSFAGTADLKINNSPGTAGQFLKSTGADSAPVWGGVVKTYAQTTATYTIPVDAFADSEHVRVNVQGSNTGWTTTIPAFNPVPATGAVLEINSHATNTTVTFDASVVAVLGDASTDFVLDANTATGSQSASLVQAGWPNNQSWVVHAPHLGGGAFLLEADYLSNSTGYAGNWDALDTPGVYRGQSATGNPTGFNSATSLLVYYARTGTSNVTHQIALDGPGNKLAFRRFLVGAGSGEPWTIITPAAVDHTYNDNAVNTADYGATVQAAIDEIKRKGWGAHDDIQTADINAIRASGFYQTSTAAQLPAGWSFANVIHNCYNPNHHTQIALHISTGTGIAIRRFSTGAWTAWSVLSTGGGNFADTDLTSTGNRTHTFSGDSLTINASNGGFITLDSQTAGGARAALSLEGGEAELALTGGADLKINGAAGANGSVLTSQGAGVSPIWQPPTNPARMQFRALGGATNNNGNALGIFQTIYQDFEMDLDNAFAYPDASTCRIQQPGLYFVDVNIGVGSGAWVAIYWGTVELIRATAGADVDLSLRHYINHGAGTFSLSIQTNRALQASHSNLRVTVTRL